MRRGEKGGGWEGGGHRVKRSVKKMGGDEGEGRGKRRGKSG